MSKTIVACRPGFLKSAEAAFAGMEIEVDPNLTTDYEFRKRELGLADLLEAEMESDERRSAAKADPKNANTYIIPLDPEALDLANEYLTYLVVRVDKKENFNLVRQVIRDTRLVKEHDDAINIRATTTALADALKNFKVHSISTCQGTTWMTN